MRTLFLNKSGHRWKNVSYAGKTQRLQVVFPDSGEIKSYALTYWEALGQFAIPFVRIKGRLEQLMEWKPDERGVALYAVNNERNRNLKYGRA